VVASAPATGCQLMTAFITEALNVEPDNPERPPLRTPRVPFGVQLLPETVYGGGRSLHQERPNGHCLRFLRVRRIMGFDTGGLPVPCWTLPFSLAPPGALLRTLVAPYSALSTREIAE